jgi:hypothetical protein
MVVLLLHEGCLSSIDTIVIVISIRKGAVASKIIPPTMAYQQNSTFLHHGISSTPFRGIRINNFFCMPNTCSITDYPTEGERVDIGHNIENDERSNKDANTFVGMLYFSSISI